MATTVPPLVKRLTPLVLVVLLAHVLGLEWLAQRGTATGALALMAEPEFNQALTPSSTQPSQAPGIQAEPTPPTSTVGQVVQARTLVLPAAPSTSATHSHRPAPPKSAAPTPAPAQTPPPAGPEPTPGADAELASPPPEPTPGPTEQASAPATAPPPSPAPPPAQTATAPAPEAAQRAVQPPSPPVADGTAGAPAVSGMPGPNAWLAAWPASTRLSYKLQGYFRGDLSGHARVLWQRTGERYQAQIDVSVGFLLSMRMTSQGRITPTHLWPEAYEDDRQGKKRVVRFGDQEIRLDDGTTLPRPAHLQDVASQFVQLAQDFATGRRPLVVGEVVNLSLGRPGGVDDWVYDVVAQDTLHTPLGDISAFHLKPRPMVSTRARVHADMWFAPALQHLPVRIKLTLNEDTWLDLNLTAVAQSP